MTVTLKDLSNEELMAHLRQLRGEEAPQPEVPQPEIPEQQVQQPQVQQEMQPQPDLTVKDLSDNELLEAIGIKAPKPTGIIPC